MDLSEEACRLIFDWAENEPAVEAALLFGSRARGTSQAASDVDLALVLRDKATPVETFIANGEHWQNQLRALTGMLVNLEILAGDKTPIAAKYVAECNVELFRRGSQ